MTEKKKTAAAEKTAAAKTAAAEAPAIKPDALLRVTTSREGFRRAGRAWHGTTEVAKDELTGEEIALIEAEPMLTVERV